MNTLSTIRKVVTTKELAKQLCTSPKVVLTNARKCLPMKKINNGKTTLWNEDEVTVLLEFVKNHKTDRPNTTFTKVSKGIETSLTRDFKAQMFVQAIEKAHKDYENFLEECNHQLEIQNQKLSTQNKELLEDLGREKSYRTIKSVEMETGKHFRYSELRNYSKQHGYEIHKAFDQNYGEVNAYHVDVWNKVYGLELD